MDAETLLLLHKPTDVVRRLTLDKAWPVHSAVAWQEGLSLRHEDIYVQTLRFVTNRYPNVPGPAHPNPKSREGIPEVKAICHFNCLDGPVLHVGLPSSRPAGR